MEGQQQLRKRQDERQTETLARIINLMQQTLRILPGKPESYMFYTALSGNGISHFLYKSEVMFTLKHKEPFNNVVFVDPEKLRDY